MLTVSADGPAATVAVCSRHCWVTGRNREVPSAVPEAKESREGTAEEPFPLPRTSVPTTVSTLKLQNLGEEKRETNTGLLHPGMETLSLR